MQDKRESSTGKYHYYYSKTHSGETIIQTNGASNQGNGCPYQGHRKE